MPSTNPDLKHYSALQTNTKVEECIRFSTANMCINLCCILIFGVSLLTRERAKDYPNTPAKYPSVFTKPTLLHYSQHIMPSGGIKLLTV